MDLQLIATPSLDFQVALNLSENAPCISYFDPYGMHFIVQLQSSAKLMMYSARNALRLCIKLNHLLRRNISVSGSQSKAVLLSWAISVVLQRFRNRHTFFMDIFSNIGGLSTP